MNGQFTSSFTDVVISTALNPWRALAATRTNVFPVALLVCKIAKLILITAPEHGFTGDEGIVSQNGVCLGFLS